MSESCRCLAKMAEAARTPVSQTGASPLILFVRDSYKLPTVLILSYHPLNLRYFMLKRNHIYKSWALFFLHTP